MKIKMLVMDVDGTLTDGKIYIGNQGEVMKAFNVKDGYGIAHLKDAEILPVIITGRKSSIVELYQSVENKLECLKQIATQYQVLPEEIAYIGDDLNDLECMRYCGIAACPKDAICEVKNYVDYICKFQGGQGAVREFIKFLIDGGENERD